MAVERGQVGPIRRSIATGMAVVSVAALGGVDVASAKAAPFARYSSCASLSPFSVGEASPATRQAAITCFQLEKGTSGKKVLVFDVTGGFTPKNLKEISAGAESYLAVSSQGLLTPDIAVQEASAGTKKTAALQDTYAGDNCAPIDQIAQTPVAVVSAKQPRDDFVVVEATEQGNNCEGIAYEPYGVANVFTGVVTRDIGQNLVEKIAKTDAHEIAHLFRLGHSGRFTRKTPASILNLSNYLSEVEYHEYDDPNNIMGTYNPTETMTFNPVQKAILEWPEVELHKAPPKAQWLGEKWLPISKKKASRGDFALAHLDQSFSKNGYQDAITFDSFAFLPQQGPDGKITGVEITAYDSIKTHNTAVIGTQLLTSDITTFVYGNTAFQLRLTKDGMTMRTLPLDQTTLSAFIPRQPGTPARK